MKSYSCCSSTEALLARLGSVELRQRYQNILRHLAEFYEFEYDSPFGTDYQRETDLLGVLDALCRKIQALEG